MRIHRGNVWAVVAALLVGLATFTRPALGLEDGLMGVRIGASYREVLRRLGPSHGILFAAGGSIMYQTQPRRGAAGLPSFGTQATTTDQPVWALPLRPAGLAEGQTEWVYDWRQTKGVVLGVVFSGEGADAVVTDVIVAGFPQYLKGKPTPVRTERGIRLQDSFARVLQKYGFPPMIEIYAPSGAGAAPQRAAAAAGRGGAPAGGGRAMRAGGAGGARGGAGGGARGRGGGMMGGGRRGGGMRGALPQAGTALATRPTYQIRLTGGMGGMMGGGGRRGGGMGGARGGGMGGGRGGGMAAGRGAGARGAVGLPPLGQQAIPGGGRATTVTAVVDNQAITFARDCILTYEGIAFTLHDLKVVRIHVSE